MSLEAKLRFVEYDIGDMPEKVEREVQHIQNNSKTSTCFSTTDMFINSILMIFGEKNAEFSPLSFPKARNALKLNYLTKKCKILFQGFQFFQTFNFLQFMFSFCDYF